MKTEKQILQLGRERAIVRNWNPDSTETKKVANEIINAVMYGYETAISDNINKKFTENDVINAILLSREGFTKDYKPKYSQDEILKIISEPSLIKNGDVFDIGQTINGVSRFLWFNGSWYYYNHLLAPYDYDQKELTDSIIDELKYNNSVKLVKNILD